MTEQTINIVVNPAYSKTNWFSDFKSGVFDRAYSAKINIVMYENNLSEICSLCHNTNDYIILVSSSSAWETEIINFLSAENIHCIIIRPSIYDSTLSCSSVSPDYFNAAFKIMKYFIETGSRRIAFFAYNSDSSQDVQKYKAYKYALSLSGLPFSKDDVYINYGNAAACAEELLKQNKTYDALICANDAAAIILINKLKGKEFLKSVDIASFGNTKLLKMLFPNIISASLNFKKAGECAADLYLYLCCNKSVVSCEYTVSSDINIPSPKEKIYSLITNRNTTKTENGVSFYNDTSVIEVFKTENALAMCDELDMQIINLIRKNYSYEKTAEHTNTAVSTVKYRLKKIYSNFGVTSKNELCNLFNKYFN